MTTTSCVTLAASSGDNLASQGTKLEAVIVQESFDQEEVMQKIKKVILLKKLLMMLWKEVI